MWTRIIEAKFFDLKACLTYQLIIFKFED